MASEGEVTYCMCIECCRLFRLATFVVANAAFSSSVITFFNSESLLSFLRTILCFMSEGSLELLKRRGSYEE